MLSFEKEFIRDNELLYTFYDDKSKIGYAHLIDNEDSFYIEWFETLKEGYGYARKMLETLKNEGLDIFEGDALEIEQKSFWKHVGAKFDNGSQFELYL